MKSRAAVAFEAGKPLQIVEISCPAPATPMTTLWPQPRCALFCRARPGVQ